MDVRLPPVFEVNQKRNGNTIQKLLAPRTTVNATVANFHEGKLKGKIILPDKDDSRRIIVVEKQTVIPSGIARAIRGQIATDSAQVSVDLSGGEWLKHPQLTDAIAAGAAVHVKLQEVVDSWRGSFSYIAEEPARNITGLRNPQIGAIHNIHGHWTVSDAVATVVMPTGTGKTETMLSVMVSVPCEKILVVVPTDALRNQLAEKFLTLGVLKAPGCKVLLESAAYPVVGILRHKPKDATEVDDLFTQCHVVVTTSQIRRLVQ